MFFLPNQTAIHKELKLAFSPLANQIWTILGLSLVINLLILAPTWYMLEIYSRVVTSRSHNTLVMLTLLIALAYLLLEAMSFVRSRLMYLLADDLDKSLRIKIFDTIFAAKLRQPNFSTIQGLLDLKAIQEAIVSPAFTALIDCPIAIFTLVIIFLYDPFLGWLSLAGVVILCFIAIFNFKRVEPLLTEANAELISCQKYINDTVKNAQVIKAMAMDDGIKEKWLLKHNKSSSLQFLASNRAAKSSSISKILQITQGSLTLGMGCWLVMTGYLAGGSSEIIVNSMLASRALAPIVLIVSLMKVLINGKDAVNRLNNLLRVYKDPISAMKLPVPKPDLVVEGLSVNDPMTNQNILRSINFKIPSGHTLAILGPSASGKTTLARLLTGIWPASAGSIRLDGVDIYSWNKEELGPFVGYLPQDVELFDGTIAENIARFSDLDQTQIEEAAKIVGIHDFIMSLKNGYEQHMNDDAMNFSGGQKQRIALARAFYGNPKFIVLDEPNSNLDEEGELALIEAIKSIKLKGSTVVIITHKINIVSNLDFMLILSQGQIKAFGPTEEILKKLKALNTPKNITNKNEINES